MVPGFIFLGFTSRRLARRRAGREPRGEHDAGGSSGIRADRPPASISVWYARRCVPRRRRASSRGLRVRGAARAPSALHGPEDGASSHLCVFSLEPSPDLRSSLTRLDSTAQADARDQGVPHHRQAQGRQERRRSRRLAPRPSSRFAAPSTSTPWWLTTSTRRTSSSSPCPPPSPRRTSKRLSTSAMFSRVLVHGSCGVGSRAGGRGVMTRGVTRFGCVATQLATDGVRPLGSSPVAVRTGTRVPLLRTFSWRVFAL